MNAAFYDRFRSLIFRVDAEVVHHWALKAIARGWINPGIKTIQDPVEHFGVKFPNRVGLAAGFDKDGLAINQWQNFGFGFVEIGTVTRHAQPGNPKPRLFRLIPDQAVINRMGFNNQGADALLRRLESAQPGIPLGINIGKSKVTEIEEAAEDYAYSFKLLREHGDYFAVNVSSPNTPGLRSLQGREFLAKILWRLKEIDSRKPLLIKIAPDLEEPAIDEIIEVASDFNLTGVIATNTTLSRTGLKNNPNQEGGLSGAPLTTRAQAVTTYLRKNCPADMVIIGSGGIMTAQDAINRRQAGSDLIQLYTGWIYGGPKFPFQIAEALTANNVK